MNHFKLRDNFATAWDDKECSRRIAYDILNLIKYVNDVERRDWPVKILLIGVVATATHADDVTSG